MKDRFLRVSGLTLVMLLFVGSSVKADDSFSYTFSSSAPAVSVTFDGGNGHPSPAFESTFAGPFTVTQLAPAGPTFQAFCIDLWHNTSTGGGTFGGNYTAVNGSTNFNSPQMFADNYVLTGTQEATLANQLNYLGTVYAQITGGLTGTALADGLGAVQLAIWNLVDQPGLTLANSAGTSIGLGFENGDANMTADFKSIIAALGGQTSVGGVTGMTAAGNVLADPNGSGTNKVEGVTLNNYASGTPYSGGTIVQVTGAFDSGRSQNLLTWDSNVSILSASAPEPSTFAIAGLGVLGFLGYGWKRRKHS